MSSKRIIAPCSPQASHYENNESIANSPNFNPIEKAFSKLKALLRKAAERSVDALWDRIGALLNEFSQAECANYFAAAGCDPL